MNICIIFQVTPKYWNVMKTFMSLYHICKTYVWRQFFLERRFIMQHDYVMFFGHTWCLGSIYNEAWSSVVPYYSFKLVVSHLPLLVVGFTNINLTLFSRKQTMILFKIIMHIIIYVGNDVTSCTFCLLVIWWALSYMRMKIIMKSSQWSFLRYYFNKWPF